MSIDAGTLVKDLTIAQQQMVEIVKAISYHSRILVMDEPTSSISDKEVEFLFSTMRELTKRAWESYIYPIRWTSWSRSATG